MRASGLRSVNQLKVFLINDHTGLKSGGNCGRIGRNWNFKKRHKISPAAEGRTGLHKAQQGK